MKTTACAMISAMVMWAAVMPRPGYAAEKGVAATVKALEEDEKQKVLSVMKDNQDAVVMVEIVVNITATYQGQQRSPREKKLRINGTTIDESGLTVISNSRSDPMALLSSRMKKLPGFSVDVEVLESKLILNDGTELPAKVALKDADLDLAFVVPAETQKGLAHVTLDPDTDPSLLDLVCSISRMDLSANRTPLIHLGRVAGIIEKPRTYYVGPGVSPGLPAFDEDGRCFGLFLRRKGPDGPSGSPVILPASDVLEIARQLMKKKSGEQ